MARKLDGKKVAILVADGFEQVEMTKPRQALDEAGAQTKIVSLKAGKIQGMNHADKGDKFGGSHIGSSASRAVRRVINSGRPLQS